MERAPADGPHRQGAGFDQIFCPRDLFPEVRACWSGRFLPPIRKQNGVALLDRGRDRRPRFQPAIRFCPGFDDVPRTVRRDRKQIGSDGRADPEQLPQQGDASTGAISRCGRGRIRHQNQQNRSGSGEVVGARREGLKIVHTREYAPAASSSATRRHVPLTEQQALFRAILKPADRLAGRLQPGGTGQPKVRPRASGREDQR